jgi:N utilization substance protein B
MQTLCQGDVQGPLSDPDLVAYLIEVESKLPVRNYAMELARFVWSNQSIIDEEIEASAPNWELDRISPVERNTMRVAAAELLLGEVPPPVALNEAIEIVKEYGGQDSPRFVNGVLNQVLETLRPDAKESRT